MKRTRILVSMIVVAALAMGAVAAEDAATTKPASRPAEQKVLDRFVGNWQGTTAVHKAKWHPNEPRRSYRSSCVRILGGRFTMNKSVASDGSTSLILDTYDSQRKCYRHWHFDSQGICIELQGKWDAKTKTMTWRNKNDNGVTSVLKSCYLDANTPKWSYVVKDGDGEIGYHAEGKAKRVKQLPKRKAAPAAKPAERSAEMKVLDFFVGDWKTTFTAPKAPWNPKAISQTGRSSIVRVLQGRFNQDNGKISGGTAYLYLTTYDVRRKCYRMWFFDSWGFTSESRGKWDAKTKTMTRLTEQDNGITTTIKVRVVDNDTFEWSTIVKDPDGKAVFQANGKNTRTK